MNSFTIIDLVCQAFEQTVQKRKDKKQNDLQILASEICVSLKEADEILKNSPFTLEVFKDQFSFSATRYRISEQQIEGALAGTSDDLELFAGDTTKTLVIDVSISRALRRNRGRRAFDGYIPSRLARNLSERLQRSLGARMSFGFRTATGFVGVFALTMPVDTDRLTEAVERHLDTFRCSPRLASIRVVMTRKIAFFVCPRYAMINDRLLPWAFSLSSLRYHAPERLLPGFPIALPQELPRLQETILRHNVVALLTFFPRRRRAAVLQFLRHLFHWFVMREKLPTAPGFVSGSVPLSSNLLSCWNDDYTSIIRVLEDQGVLVRVANNNRSSGYRAGQCRHYLLVRKRIRKLDLKAMMTQLVSAPIPPSKLARQIGISARTLRRWKAEPDAVNPEILVRFLQASLTGGITLLLVKEGETRLITELHGGYVVPGDAYFHGEIPPCSSVILLCTKAILSRTKGHEIPLLLAAELARAHDVSLMTQGIPDDLADRRIAAVRDLRADVAYFEFLKQTMRVPLNPSLIDVLVENRRLSDELGQTMRVRVTEFLLTESAILLSSPSRMRVYHLLRMIAERRAPKSIARYFWRLCRVCDSIAVLKVFARLLKQCVFVQCGDRSPLRSGLATIIRKVNEIYDAPSLVQTLRLISLSPLPSEATFMVAVHSMSSDSIRRALLLSNLFSGHSGRIVGAQHGTE